MQIAAAKLQYLGGVVIQAARLPRRASSGDQERSSGRDTAERARFPNRYQEKATTSTNDFEAAHDERLRSQREGELSVKMNAMIRGYLTRRAFEKKLRRTGLVASGISQSMSSHAENVLSQIKDAERIRRQALFQQQTARKEILRDVQRAIKATNDALRAGAEFAAWMAFLRARGVA